jgi:hypothetical protein
VPNGDDDDDDDDDGDDDDDMLLMLQITKFSCLPLALPSRIEPKFCLPSNNKGHNSDQN